MADKIERPLFLVETKILDTIVNSYCQADVLKAGYTPIGIVAVDATGLAGANSIRLFYIQDTLARVSFNNDPDVGAYVTAKILYQKV